MTQNLPTLSAISLAKLIDHTALKPETTSQDIEKLCSEARSFQFATVCIPAQFIEQAKSLLQDSLTQVITVIDFPKGSASSSNKMREALSTIKLGATEIDMVLDYEKLKQNDFKTVFNGIRAVSEVCESSKVLLKVILETAALSDDEIIAGCVLSKAAGAQFVKTSTGFGPGGATEHSIQLMRKTVGNEMGVKASGGIRTLESALKMIRAGANRIGSSNSVQIIESLKNAQQ